MQKLEKLILVFFAMTTLGCSSDPDKTVEDDTLRVPDSLPAESSVDFTIQFSGAIPAVAAVRSGGTATFENRDDIAHHIKASLDGEAPFFDSDAVGGFGRFASVQFVLESPGNVEVWCELHANGFRIPIRVDQ